MSIDKAHIDQLKAKLNLLLSGDKIDFDEVIKTTSEIGKLDQESVRFSVDAGIINRLGKELVGRHETAVSELVKNAYDADAHQVLLTFKNAWTPGGTLILEDDGSGMTRDQLINGFMRLSSSDKLHHPHSPKYDRRRAGRKGIGRFSTQRLGSKLTIITQTEDSRSALKISIDWDQFEIDQDLTAVSSKIEVVSKVRNCGTTLTIENLREAWSDAMIKRAYRYTSDLLQPFPLSAARKHEEKERTDPGFKSEYYREEGDDLIKIVDDDTAFLEHALAEIEGYVTSDGHGWWTLKSKKLEYEKTKTRIGKNRDDDKAPFSFIHGCHFKCYYFIYETSLLPPQTMSFIREVANERGGIRLYRNGFRVLPYGEKGDDWIGLDDSARKRVIVAAHQNISFFGFVEITDEKGDQFEETSSREGLIENDAFKELTDFVYRSITGAILKVAELRGRKGTAAQKDWKREDVTKDVDSTIGEIKQLATEIVDAEIKSGEGHTDGKREVLVEKIRRLVEVREIEKERSISVIEEMNMLRILAGLGLVIGEFVHEVKRFWPAFHTDILFLKNALKNYGEALQRADRLDTNLKSFTSYTSYFDKAISQNVLRELESIELRDVVHGFIETITRDIERSNVTIDPPDFREYDLFTVPMHRSEWASILFNLYTNSKKAIRRQQVDGRIKISCGREKEKVYLEFSDNGDGIPKENEELIFNAFFTTTSVATRMTSDEESLAGSGLGLKIVKDIIESYGGEIYVGVPDEGFSTCMRIEIPQNKTDE